jgi:hypothetical protein
MCKSSSGRFSMVFITLQSNFPQKVTKLACMDYWLIWTKKYSNITDTHY